MSSLKGRFTKILYSNESTGFIVGLFRVKEVSKDLKDFDIVNKSVRFTGKFVDINHDDYYELNGEYKKDNKYGYEFYTISYNKIIPEEKDSIVEFLSSSLIRGCGEKTAQRIVNKLGKKAITKIKEDKTNLEGLGLSSKKIDDIYNSVVEYYDTNELIMEMQSLGFSIIEIGKIIKKYKNNTKFVLQNDLYALTEFVDFNKLDRIYFKLYDDTNNMRIKACIVRTMSVITFEEGNIYVNKDDILINLYNMFHIELTDSFDEYINDLIKDKLIILEDNRYYLYDEYYNELYIAKTLVEISKRKKKKIKDFNKELIGLEKLYNLDYDEVQESAIKSALENRVTIITGGPGTGKTTIIDGILRMYQELNELSFKDMLDEVILLAPTGRAAKRMGEACHYKASTIHRFLKWNKDNNEFGINEDNPIEAKLIIIDESSMMDNFLFSSLLKGLKHDISLVLVGDDFQLPSVSPGNVLKDIIDSDVFNHVTLEKIYRQSSNSYIPFLAKDIKEVNDTTNFKNKKDDYSFIVCSKTQIKSVIKDIIDLSIKKGLSEDDVQVLAPMYKGMNGIDNLNYMLQDIFNPYNKRKKEVTIGAVTYRVKDKIINLVNDVDNNIFNGDIGYIVDINKDNNDEFMIINFYGNDVTIKREDISNIRHAYAMTIHKAQGSEFDHVIIPLSEEYKRMLYNKLIYTGVSRAKKSLILVGDPQSLSYAIDNNYSKSRKTTLKNRILNAIDK